jgi:hypothetical protein
MGVDGDAAGRRLAAARDALDQIIEGGLAAVASSSSRISALIPW